MMNTMITQNLEIIWKKLPEDYILPDEPVDNINQPALAAALTESLEIAGKLTKNCLTPTNYGICATVNDKLIVKAPDWAYIANINVPRSELERSYTPKLQGDIPLIVMEFISDTDGGEYSIKPTYPPGKWYFYERILKVPSYAIFEPKSGDLEVYRLAESGQYILQSIEENSCYWIPELSLFLGVWQGTRENRNGYWLRWWDEQGQLLLWGSERVEKLAVQLRAAGIEPEV
jgi:Putative restriction endonuclease